MVRSRLASSGLHAACCKRRADARGDSRLTDPASFGSSVIATRRTERDLSCSVLFTMVVTGAALALVIREHRLDELKTRAQQNAVDMALATEAHRLEIKALVGAIPSVSINPPGPTNE